MTPQTGKQTIEIHILSNIARSEGNGGMKFGHTQNVVEKPKSESKFSIYLDL